MITHFCTYFQGFCSLRISDAVCLTHFVQKLKDCYGPLARTVAVRKKVHIKKYSFITSSEAFEQTQNANCMERLSKVLF